MTLEIIIDTREQTPWHWPPWLASTRLGTLKTGDYALRADDDFAIERKSLDDFLGTISTGWDRFMREIDRMEGWPAKVVIVEGTFSRLLFRVEEEGGELVFPDHEHHMLTPQFVLKRVAELTMRGVAVIFVDGVDNAVAVATAIFRGRNKELKSRQENQDDDDKTPSES